MTLTRREVLSTAAGSAAAILLRAARAHAAGEVVIGMAGRRDGSHVWFAPVGLWVAPGTRVRWINDDAGNAHTATAYHPASGERQRRIPEGAEPWDSGYLLPGESYAVSLVMPGVYDYFCLPHEHAGMVGRIVVGNVAEPEFGAAGTGEPPPAAALSIFPEVSAIRREREIRLPPRPSE